MKKWVFSFTTLCTMLFLFIATSPAHSEETPSILLAVLARNKAHTLPTYLNCINNLEYDKKKISLYINTNNNVDNTENILKNWITAHKHEYASIEFEIGHVDNLDSDRPHEWNTTRLKALALIRNKSLKQAIDKKVDFYFVVDCDNFIAPDTLSYLVAKKKPVIAPMLQAIPEPGDIYSNYFCAISPSGYYEQHPDYIKILSEAKKGTFEVPVVHCTYLIHKDAIPFLSYIDGTEDYEFVIFSRNARKMNIPQYICNERPFGTLLHFSENISLRQEQERFGKILSSHNNLLWPHETSCKKELTCEEVFSKIYKDKVWGENNRGEGTSGPGSSLEQTVTYRNYLQKFLRDHNIKSVVDVGCGDWSFSKEIDWSGIEYTGYDVVEEVIQKNTQLYSSSSIHFVKADISNNIQLPPADLLLCKEVLQHLPFHDIANFLTMIEPYKYCLIVNDIQPSGDTTKNVDIERGGYRCLDLREPPFCLNAIELFTYKSPPFLKQVLFIKRQRNLGHTR